MVIAMLIPSIAHAEGDIQLIAGLKFGMKIDQAAAISKFELVEEPALWKESFYKDFVGLTNTSYIFGTGKIGGYDCSVSAHFDALDRLIQVMYYFECDNPTFYTEDEISRSDHEKRYAEIEKVLTKQYGEGYNIEDAINLTIGLSDVSSIGAINFYDFYKHLFTNCEYSQRLISQSDETTVVIEHTVLERVLIGSQTDRSETETQYAHILIYTYYDFPVGQEEQSYSVGF